MSTLHTRKLTLYHFCKLAPEWFLEDIMLTGDHINHLTWSEQTHIETKGDLTELSQALITAVIKNNDTKLEEISCIFKFTMASYGTITIEEYRDIPTIQEFQDKYPNLSRSMEI